MKSEELLCETCGLPIHPNAPCSEVIQFHNQVDDEYFGLLGLILEEGRWKKNRTGVDTLGIFGAQARFAVDLDAFPILTTKKVWFKGIVHELLWFLRGDTNIKYLVDNDVHIWDNWAYKEFIDASRKHRDILLEQGCEIDYQEPTMESFIKSVKTDDAFAAEWGDLGEGTYGGMWRAFPYHTDEDRGEVNYQPRGLIKFGDVDQIQKVLDKLKSNPDDRRMIVSAWHPYWVDHCALPPCHCLFHFNTEVLTKGERIELQERTRPNITRCLWEADVTDQWLDDIDIPRRRLNLLLYQRSCDVFLGVPFNITSYCLLLAMVAHVTGMTTGVFTHTYGDLHIYRNHMTQVDIQLGRLPKLLPKLRLNPNVTDLFAFKYEDINLIGYESHPAIKAEVAV